VIVKLEPPSLSVPKDATGLFSWMDGVELVARCHSRLVAEAPERGRFALTFGFKRLDSPGAPRIEKDWSEDRMQERIGGWTTIVRL